MVGLATTLGLPLLLGAISWSHMGIVGPGPASAAAVVVRQEDSGAAAGIDEGTVPVRASPGCAQKTPVQLDTTLNVTLGDRRYLLYFPVNYKPDVPAPLVLSYHGGTRVAEFQQALDLLTTTYFNQDHIIVYPNGINFTWQGVPNVATDDITFTAAILDTLESQYCIDTARIFATGKSQGGGFASVLACDATMSRRIAAYAPVAGSYYQPNSSATGTCDPETVAVACSPGRNDVPVMVFHGLADDTIAYNGGPRRGACLPAIPYYCRLWAERDGLPLANVITAVPGALEGGSAVRYQWGDGARQGLVTHIFDGQDIGHDWPSTAPNSDNLTPGRHPASFNASALILDFFSQHPLR